MNQILLFKNDFISDETVRITGRRHVYMNTVHRASMGGTFKVGLVNGNMGTGTIRSIDGDHIMMDVILDVPPPPPLPLVIVLALPRPKMLRRILQFCGAMGIKKIFLIRTWRVEKSYWQSPALEDQHITENLILGLEQARDTIISEVVMRPLFKPFVEDELGSLSAGTLCIAAHPGSKAQCPSAVGQPVTLAIGPEGGFIPYEVEMLEKTGFTPVSIGDRILRVDCAVPYIVGKLF